MAKFLFFCAAFVWLIAFVITALQVIAVVMDSGSKLKMESDRIIYSTLALAVVSKYLFGW